MYIDISKPPPPLPQPALLQLTDGLSLLPPLSRRGHGPGILVLVPDNANASTTTTIENGVPSPAMKWAEEGYAVVEVQESVIATVGAEEVLKKAIEALKACERCDQKERVGLVAYTPSLWNAIASALSTAPAIVGGVIYGAITDHSSITSTSIPQLQHLSGRSDAKLPRTAQLTAHEYPAQTSPLFALPFQSTFSYAQEAVSHTRNLTFLKKLMDGPWFDLEDLWDEHTYFEFENRSVEWTMSTMVQEPYVNHIPTMTGGIGRDKLGNFYANHFIFKNPASTELELTSRTVGIDRVIDEFIYKFDHTDPVDWLIPGIPPTNKRVEVPFTAVVNIRGDRLYHEHIAWDQGSVLRQLGLMPEYLPFPYPVNGKTPAPGKKFEYKVPVAGVQTAEKMREKNAVESNEMFEFEVREVDA